MRGADRRMLLRGRMTLAAVLALLLAGAWFGLIHRSQPAPDRSPLPPVSATPGEELETPVSVLSPPVDRDALARVDPRTGRLTGEVPVPVGREDLEGPLHIEYSLDAALTEGVWKVLDRGRVALGHVLVLDPESGRLLAYASTDPARFPPTRDYPAASLVKVVTAAAALDAAPDVAREPCRYVGNQYRLTRARVDPPSRGHTTSLRKALASSNNQCFAQLAVHRVGRSALLDAIDRFGLLAQPAPGHASGRAEDPEDPLDLGKLGSGLAGLRITPLHAVGLAGTLAHGRRVEPGWINHVTDARGIALAPPESGLREQVLTGRLTRQIREMLVDTTVRGTARRAFRTRRGRPLLKGISVAGKTGSLNGRDPDGRYEWFIGVAPAKQPRIALAVVSVQGPLYWMSASQVAAEVMKTIFCPRGVCSEAAVERFLGGSATPASTGR